MTITGRPSYRPFIACGFYKDKSAAEAAARDLSSETQVWKAVPAHRIKGEYAIRRIS